jgi:hypothetical protein
MNRRTLVTALMASLAFAPPAWTQSFADQIVAQLRQQGYGGISVSNTLLGRTRIVAESGEGSREIIIDPRTGEILRDLWQGAGSGSIFSGSSDRSGSGRDDDDDDDDDNDNDDDDDDDDDEDNSGHGSGGDDDDSDKDND